MTEKEALIRELARLYSLRDSGKSLDALIEGLERRLFVTLYTESEPQEVGDVSQVDAEALGKARRLEVRTLR